MTAKILLKNVTVVTADAAEPVKRRTALAIEGGKIIAVGDAQGFQAEEVIDLGNRHVVMPAMFNAHTHAAMTLMRGWAEDLPLDRWLKEKIWPAEKGLVFGDVLWGTSLAACEMIRSGIVAFSDHYFEMAEVSDVVDRSGMKATLCWCLFDGDDDKSIKLTKEFVLAQRSAGHGRIRTFLGPHSAYSCDEALLLRLAQVSQELGVGCHIHVSETAQQVKDSLKRHGKTPVRHLNDLGIFANPSIAAHAIHLDDNDYEILSAQRVSVVQCPKTHFKMAMGTTNVAALNKAGVNVALGTDGCASNNDMNMFEVMRLSALSQKHHAEDPTAGRHQEILRMATANGAAAMGFHNSGTITKGADADLVIINMDKPHLTPCHDEIANLVYCARPGDVSDVLCDGKFLLRKGALTTLDEEQILHEASERAERLVRECPVPSAVK